MMRVGQLIDFSRCTRCGSEAPPTSGQQGAAAQGWITFETEDGTLLEFVCPDCLTEEEQDGAIGIRSGASSWVADQLGDTPPFILDSSRQDCLRPHPTRVRPAADERVLSAGDARVRRVIAVVA
jgi:hypothetical protein